MFRQHMALLLVALVIDCLPVKDGVQCSADKHLCKYSRKHLMVEKPLQSLQSISLKGTCHEACSSLGNFLFNPLKEELLTRQEIFIVFMSVLEERILHNMLIKREAFLILISGVLVFCLGICCLLSY